MSSLSAKPLILQIVGYQNSGKTTIAEKIIRHLTEVGYKVGSFKHHGHGGQPQLPHDKDSTRHLQAGSVAVGVAGDGMFLFHTKEEVNWFEFYQIVGVDIIIIEGYKQKHYNKIVCIRREEEVELLKQLSNIIAVFSWIPLPYQENVFPVDDIGSYCNWVTEYVRRKLNV